MGRVWSLLPLDLTASIALKLETIEDFIHFAAVCHSWNRASSLIKPQWRAASSAPWLLLPEKTNDNPNCVRKLFNISDNKFYQLNLPQTFGKRCWGSAYGWLAMVDRDLNVQLFNPITNAQISFPSFETIFKRYKDEGNWGCVDASLEEEFVYCSLNKLIVIQVCRGDRHEFVIVVLHRYHTRAAFAWHGDRTWTSILVKEKRNMFDVVVLGDNVFALYLDGSTVYWNIKELHSREIIKPIDYCPPGSRDIFDPFILGERAIYLVQFGVDLLMVLRKKEELIDRDTDTFSYETIGFRVFRLDHKHRKWEEINDLDNIVLFVGENYSISVSLDKGLKRNCIYFTDDMADYWLRCPHVAGLDMGIYDIKCRERWQLYNSDDICPSIPPPIWFIPQF